MKVIDFIIAEDIRPEIGNKFSVMGVFNDVIVVDVPSGAPRPIAFRLASFLRLSFGPKDPPAFRFAYRISLNGEEIGRFEGSGTKADDTSIATLPLVAPTLPVKEAGTFTFHLEVAEGETPLLQEDLPSVKLHIREVPR